MLFQLKTQPYFLSDILFHIRAKKAEEYFNEKCYSEAIKYDNVNETYIYYYIKNLLENKITINFQESQMKFMLLGLDEIELKELSLYNSNISIVNTFEIFKNNIFHIYELYEQNFEITNELIDYCKNIYSNFSSYMHKDQNELPINQPITFDNNHNYIYMITLYLLTNELIINKGNINNFEIIMKTINYLKDSIKNFKLFK